MTAALECNLAQVVREVQATFDAYEAALNANDVETLIGFFWQHPLAVRYGTHENLYGWDAIVAFRQQRIPPPARQLMNTVIATFGTGFATVNTEFKRGDTVGRQSQSWILTEAGWKIVSAHVSLLATQPPPETNYAASPETI